MNAENSAATSQQEAGPMDQLARAHGDPTTADRAGGDQSTAGRGGASKKMRLNGVSGLFFH
jgi:hypothetical protein